MTNNINLNSVSGAIIPYTPPKSAEEFVNGEVVKKAHEIFEKAIHFHLKECKLLKTPDDLFLRWKHLTNTNLISKSDDFFSILRNDGVLPNLFYFLDRNSLHNLSQFSSLKEDVDQYSEQIFEYYFGKSHWELTPDDLKFEGFENRLLNKAIEKHAPEIAIETFFSTLFQTRQFTDTELDEILYIAIHRAIARHAPADTILFLLRVGEIKKIDDFMEGPVNLLELSLKEKIATKEIVEALINAGAELDSGPTCTINVALQHRASKEIVEALLNAGAGLDTGPDCTIYKALEYGASIEVITTLWEAGARVDLVHINDARGFNASAEVIRLLLYAGIEVDDEDIVILCRHRLIKFHP